MDQINHRRAAFSKLTKEATPVKTSTTSPYSGVKKLKELATNDHRIKNAIKLYQWHHHKVFAINQVSEAKLQSIANAGALTYRGSGWRCEQVTSRKIVQVPTVPVDHSWGMHKAGKYIPGYWSWLHGRLMYPEQVKAVDSGTSEYKLGQKCIEASISYKVFQYLTIISDILNDIFSDHTGSCFPDNVKTLYQVNHSLKNLLNSQAHHDVAQSDQDRQQAAEKAATRMASLLCIRDGDKNNDSAYKFKKMADTLPPRVFLQAMRLIASDKVQVQDSSGAAVKDEHGNPLASSSLFHHSVFYDGDLVFISLLFAQHRDIESFIPYMVCRILSSQINRLPVVPLADCPGLDDAVARLHQLTGKHFEYALQKAYFTKLMLMEVLCKQPMTLPATKNIIADLLTQAKSVNGITSLIMALVPETVNIPKLNTSLAEMLFVASEYRGDNKRIVIPVSFFKNPRDPILLSAHIAKNHFERTWLLTLLQSADWPEVVEKPDMQPSTSDKVVQARSRLAGIISDFRENPAMLNHVNNKVKTRHVTPEERKLFKLKKKQSKENKIHKDISYSEVSAKTRHARISAAETDQPTREICISSCNQLLIEYLYGRIARLVLSQQWDDLIELFKEIVEMESLINQISKQKELPSQNDGVISAATETLKQKGYPNTLLVGQKKVRTLVRHIMERQLIEPDSSAKKIDTTTLYYVFTQLGITRYQGNTHQGNTEIPEVSPDFRPTEPEENPACCHIQPIRGMVTHTVNRNRTGINVPNMHSKHSSQFIARIVDLAFSSPNKTRAQLAECRQFSDQADAVSDGLFLPLPICIKRQKQRQLMIASIAQMIDECCCICFEDAQQNRMLFNPHNAHETMKICGPCVTALLDAGAKCPGCRADITEASFAGYKRPRP